MQQEVAELTLRLCAERESLSVQHREHLAALIEKHAVALGELRTDTARDLQQAHGAELAALELQLAACRAEAEEAVRDAKAKLYNKVKDQFEQVSE